MLDKSCVYLNDIPNDCSECEERPATVYIEIDLGFMTASIGDGRYCEQCGKEELARILELLPPPSNSEALNQAE